MLLVEGVNLEGLHPVMRIVKKIVGHAFKMCTDREAIITSGVDREHSDGSLHPFGGALDFRTNHVTDEQLDDVRLYLEQHLVPLGFQLIWHTTHLHIEPGDDLAKQVGLMF